MGLKAGDNITQCNLVLLISILLMYIIFIIKVRTTKKMDIKQNVLLLNCMFGSDTNCVQ